MCLMSVWCSSSDLAQILSGLFVAVQAQLLNEAPETDLLGYVSARRYVICRLQNLSGLHLQ